MILKRFAAALVRASGVKTYGLADERVSVILAQQKKISKFRQVPGSAPQDPNNFKKKKNETQ